MSKERDDTLAAYQVLLRAERQYAEYPNPHTHRALIRAQQPYYARLTRFLRAHYPPQEARIQRAQALVARASINRKQQRTSKDWQNLALHQCHRARVVQLRVQALSDDDTTPTEPATATATAPPTSRLLRVRHPLTGAVRWYDATTDTYHRKHP